MGDWSVTPEEMQKSELMGHWRGDKDAFRRGVHLLLWQQTNGQRFGRSKT